MASGRAGGAEVGALERVDGDVDLGRAVLAAARADLLADVEHRRLVALALADDDPAVDGQGVHLAPHRLDRDVVGVLAVAAAHGLRGGDGRLLGDADEVLLEEVGPWRAHPRARRRRRAHRAAVSSPLARRRSVGTGALKAGMPVIASPMIRAWMSWVPS